MDLFYFKGKNYLVCVDYYSNNLEVCLLRDNNSKTVISHIMNRAVWNPTPDTMSQVSVSSIKWFLFHNTKFSEYNSDQISPRPITQSPKDHAITSRDINLINLNRKSSVHVVTGVQANGHTSGA